MPTRDAEDKSAGSVSTRSNAADHGPTCAETPIDHRCGDTEQDQGVTWAEGLRIDSEKLHRIIGLHAKTEGVSGTTDGSCSECGHPWPCPTYHVAAGWGLDSFYECEDAEFCSHSGIRWSS